MFVFLLGIRLRERTAPLKYTLDQDLVSSSSEDESSEPFPKERCIKETWIGEVEITHKYSNFTYFDQIESIITTF